MANIRPIYEDASKTTQLYPQTHERAVIDSNGTTAETKFQMITDLVQQAQMEIGAVPSDLTPIPNSTNWVTSGGVYANIHSLGEKCALPSQIETTQEAEVGQWNTSGSIGTTADIRCHLKILSKNNTAIKVVIPSNWYGSFFYVDDNNVSQQNITQGWRNGTVELTLNGIYDLMVNIKYGSAGTTIIDQSLVNGVNWGITHYFGGNYKPAAPYDEFVELQNNVESNNEDIETINDTLFSGGEEKVIDNSNAESENYKSYEGNTLTRGYLSVPVDAMYDYSVNILVKNNSPIKASLQGWATFGDFNSYVYVSPSWILPNNSFTYSKNNPSIVELAIIATYIDGNTGIPTWAEFLQYIEFSVTYTDAYGLVKRVEDLEEYHKDKGHPYYGQPLGSFTFGIENDGSYPSTVTPTQGMAISGIYCVQGSSTEQNGKTKAELINMNNRTKIADLLLSHDGYSAIHCNMMCFGSEMIEGGIMPLLYVSQWDGQTCCFVYDIKTDGATLMQVIDPSLLTKDGVRFGVGNVDWLVDTDNNYLYALSYKGTGYSGGQIITRFHLPILSDGNTIQLTDTDIIGYNDLGNYIICQDGCYKYGLLYLLFGSPNGYADQLAIHVVSTFSMCEVTTLPLTFLTVEPEGIDFYNNELMLHLINANMINKIVY